MTIGIELHERLERELRFSERYKGISTAQLMQHVKHDVSGVLTEKTAREMVARWRELWGELPAVRAENFAGNWLIGNHEPNK